MIKSWEDIPGYFDYKITYDNVIDHLACPTDGSGILVECGCYLGKSLCYLGQKVKESKKKWKVIGIDNCLGINQSNQFNKEERYYELIRNVYRCNLEDIVQVLLEDSIESAKSFIDNSVSFVFLDTQHTYSFLSREIDAWIPKIEVNGVIGGDDIGLPQEKDDERIWPDVKKVVSDKFGTNWQYSPHDAWIHFKRK